MRFITILLPIILASCSLSKKIERSAKEVLNDSSLQTAHIGVSIYEPATKKYLFNYQDDKFFVPASNTKIPTCYAGMKFLGDSLNGMKYLIVNDSFIRVTPSGDPSFLHNDFVHQPLYDFLNRFKYISLTNSLFAEDFMGNGWAWDDFQEAYAAKRSNFPIYGNTFRIHWKNDDSIITYPAGFQKYVAIMEKLETGFQLVSSFEENAFLLQNGNLKVKDVPFRPDILTIRNLLNDTLKNSFINISFDKTGSAQTSHHVFFKESGQAVIPNPKMTSEDRWLDFKTHPTDSILQIMMHRSDNFFAEQVLMMVSEKLFGEMKDEKPIDSLLKTDFRDLSQRPRWVDGSGLSRYNLFTPRSLVVILDKMQKEFGMERIKTVFPTGNEGTLRNYYTSAQDAIFAKTGTLSGVVALSGFLYTKKNRLLIFSVLVNHHRANASAVRRAVEGFLLKIRERY